jgi:8-oxo-dGTP pyrophosphatase MutT (NUDIX family)
MKSPPTILHVIEFFCTDGKGRWLLHRRGPTCSDEIGKWDFGGGKQEYGECRFTCLVRETREEYGAGTKIMATRAFPGYTMFYEHRDYRQHLEVTPYSVLIDPTTLDPRPMIDRGKMIEWAWFDICASEFRTDEFGQPLAVIKGIPIPELHPAIPFVLHRYARELYGIESLGRILEDGQVNHQGIPMSSIFKSDVSGMHTIRTKPHVVMIEN